MFWTKDLIELFFIAHKELLNALNLFFELYSDLVHLGTLHIGMINLISSNRTIISLFLISYDQFMVDVVSVSKFVDNELLHLDDVNDIHLCFDGVKNQYADLTSYTAKAVVLQN